MLLVQTDRSDRQHRALLRSIHHTTWLFPRTTLIDTSDDVPKQKYIRPGRCQKHCMSCLVANRSLYLEIHTYLLCSSETAGLERSALPRCLWHYGRNGFRWSGPQWNSMLKLGMDRVCEWLQLSASLKLAGQYVGNLNNTNRTVYNTTQCTDEL